ncbi:MAG: uracil-DNA glycosylase [Candidatus Riflebacteria bacterium]|nr:uracil-DNA glycosylase [Candidatus Riflebacteria bacterium]
MNCRECAHFFITWEGSTPYGCRSHGFKSAQIPSMVVFSSSGEHCLLFKRKSG